MRPQIVSAILLVFAASTTAYCQSSDSQVDLSALEHRGREYSNKRQWARAQSVYRTILEKRRQTLPALDPRLIGPLNDVIRVTCVDGKCADTVPLLNDLLAIRLKHSGLWHADVATTYALIAEANEKMHRYPEAVKNFNQAAKVRDRIYGKSASISVQTRMNVIRIALKNGDKATAKATLAECRALIRSGGKPQPELDRVLSYYASKI